MRLLCLVSFLSVTALSSGFAPKSIGGIHKAAALFSEPGTPAPRRPTPPDEILKQAQAGSGIAKESEEALKLFSDPLYDDIQQVLLSLERRVKDGPGELSMLEVEDMVTRGQRILAEMKDFEGKRIRGEVESPKAPVAVQGAIDASSTEVAEGSAEIGTSDEDGPAYDGTGGLGLAKGTANTYVIPGMEEMAPEEYRTALQKSISDRQTERKKAGNYGNRSAFDYLNALGGETGYLKKNEDEEK